MIKIIYAEKAKEGISRERFVRRWRKHGAFAMEHDDFWNPVNRYLHNNAVVNMPAFHPSQADYDGVGELVFANLEDCSRCLSAPSLRDIALDADEFFSRRDLISLVCESHQLYRERFAEIKVFSFIHCAHSVGEEQFFAQWNRQLERFLEVSGKSAGIRELTSSRPLKPTATRPVMPGSDFDAVVEISFDTPAAALEGYRQWLAVITDSADSCLIDPASMVTVVTHSSLQYDASHFD
ncbi:MAG: EthD domain-containing protein [Porticoccaceae bacterium]